MIHVHKLLQAAIIAAHEVGDVEAVRELAQVLQAAEVLKPLVDLIEEGKAKNYVTTDVALENGKAVYSITLQRVGGETPAERENELTAEVEALRKQVATARLEGAREAWRMLDTHFAFDDYGGDEDREHNAKVMEYLRELFRVAFGGEP